MIPPCRVCGSQETQFVGLHHVCLSCGATNAIHEDPPASPWPSTDDAAEPEPEAEPEPKAKRGKK